MSTSTDHSHAVVVGASMAGLLTARVLTDHFDRVTIVERDRLPDGPAFRRGVPQSQHLHTLMPGGRDAVESLLPGFEAELVGAGAHIVRWPEDGLWLMPEGWSTRFTSPHRHRLFGVSRALIEWTVRRRVLLSDRITVVDGAEVSRLIHRSGGVSGVEVRDRGDREGTSARTLMADLVVDASGRTSRAPDWLAALGYQRPEESRIDSFLGYATQQFVREPGPNEDWKGIYLMAKPPEHSRTGLLFPIEGGRWMATLAGGAGDYPPTDDEGFMAFARSLRSPVLYEALRGAHPVTAVTGYRRTDNRRRHYERLRQWPEAFAVVGDAACAFNPVYGQGMSVAALTALALDRALRDDRRLRGFQKTVAECGAGAWLLATGEDLRYPTTEGSKATVATRLTHRYFDRVLRAAAVDASTNEAFVDVLTFLRPPDSLFHPRIVAAALRRHVPASNPPAAVASVAASAEAAGAVRPRVA